MENISNVEEIKALIALLDDEDGSVRMEFTNQLLTI